MCVCLCVCICKTYQCGVPIQRTICVAIVTSMLLFRVLQYCTWVRVCVVCVFGVWCLWCVCDICVSHL